MPFNVHGAPCAPSFPPRNAEVLGMAPDRRRITRLIAKLFKADPGAQARFSALTGENETTIAHWFSDDSRRQYRMPVDLLADAVEALGKVEIYAAIVAENGLNPPGRLALVGGAAAALALASALVVGLACGGRS